MPDLPVAPRRAASVLLLQDGPAGLEVFVLRRAARMAFAAGMTAFPGGAVDPADVEVAVDGLAWDRRWGASESGPTVVAAVREVLEEVGVALLASPDGAPATIPADLRRDLTDHRLALAGVLRTTGTRLRDDWLVPAGRWITPESQPRRYDTFFYLARLPAGATADSCTTEAEAGGWARPDRLLADAAAGALVLLPPTRAQLVRLVGLSSVDEALTADWPLAPVLPRIVSGPGEPLRVEVGAP